MVIMKHFETLRAARKYVKELPDNGARKPHIYRKISGMRNKGAKPFVVGTEIEWLNQY